MLWRLFSSTRLMRSACVVHTRLVGLDWGGDPRTPHWLCPWFIYIFQGSDGRSTPNISKFIVTVFQYARAQTQHYARWLIWTTTKFQDFPGPWKFSKKFHDSPGLYRRHGNPAEFFSIMLTASNVCTTFPWTEKNWSASQTLSLRSLVAGPVHRVCWRWIPARQAASALSSSVPPSYPSLFTKYTHKPAQSLPASMRWSIWQTAKQLQMTQLFIA